MTDAERREYQAAAHKDLMRYRDAMANIRHFKEGITIMEARLDASASAFDQDKIIIHGGHGTMEDKLFKLIDLRLEYESREYEAEWLCAELEFKISHWLCGVEQRILRAYYIYLKPLNQIANDESFSYSQIKRFKSSALGKYGAKLYEYKWLRKDEPE